MRKAPREIIEKRKYLRLKAPLNISYSGRLDGKTRSIIAKDISADGIRFETHDKGLKRSDLIELQLNIPDADTSLKARGKIIWNKKLSLEDNSPSDVGIEFIDIEEGKKDIMLKFLCDIIYSLPEEKKRC
ncbi:MAG: PilZ domain-containing protein [Candidatus Omnitrophota bacterium]|nr:PilZ domain-containing protein [Candidatus Omnitrophota bacterium]